jgi:uncharacterized membrane protein YfcA
VFAHFRRGGVDMQMGWVLVGGGLIGSLLGAFLFRLLQATGQIDTVINLLYVVLLGGIGSLMMRDAVRTLRHARREGAPPAAKRRHHPVIAALPLRWRFYASGLYISPLAPLLLGVGTGILTVLLGIGGGFIMVPAMIYLLGMGTRVVVGTSLFQILFVTAATTLINSLTTHSVDIVLAALMLLGSVIGAQLGAILAQRVKPDFLRVLLAALVLIVAIRMAIGLGWRPDDIYTVQVS